MAFVIGKRDDGAEEAGLALEIIVERGLRQPGGLEDLFDGRAGVTALRERLDCGFEHGLTGITEAFLHYYRTVGNRSAESTPNSPSRRGSRISTHTRRRSRLTGHDYALFPSRDAGDLDGREQAPHLAPNRTARQRGVGEGRRRAGEGLREDQGRLRQVVRRSARPRRTAESAREGPESRRRRLHYCCRREDQRQRQPLVSLRPHQQRRGRHVLDRKSTRL